MKKFIFLLTFLFVIGPVPNTILGVYFDTILLTSILLLFLNKKNYETNTEISSIRKLIFVPLVYFLFIGLPVTLISDLTLASLDFMKVIFGLHNQGI